MLQTWTEYPSDLTEPQWKYIKNLLPSARSGGRPRTTDPWRVVNAILYVTRTGCAWRYLPKEFPPWQTVYDYFSRWRSEGVWAKVHNHLAQKVRIDAGRNRIPSTLIIDGQSIKAQYGEERGWDGFKKVRGRKRQILVDTIGILWGAKVHRGNQQESTRAYEILSTYPKNKKLPKRVLGDSGYGKAPFNVQLYKKWRIWPEIRRGTKEKYRNSNYKLRVRVGKSNLKPQRWIVERSFAWMNNFRRLNRDYERKVANSEAFLYVSQIPILLNRLEPV